MGIQTSIQERPEELGLVCMAAVGQWSRGGCSGQGGSLQWSGGHCSGHRVAACFLALSLTSPDALSLRQVSVTLEGAPETALGKAGRWEAMTEALGRSSSTGSCRSFPEEAFLEEQVSVP